MEKTAHVADRRAAAVFAVPRQRTILLALVAAEQSLAELSRLTQTPLNLLYHHVRKFIDLDLAVVTRVEPRAGSPVKYYRATAQAFFVPSELTDSRAGDVMSKRLRDSLERSHAGSARGTIYWHDGAGPRLRLVKHAGRHEIVTELWRELHLSDAEATSLAEELRSLLGRYSSPSRRKRRRYIVHAAVAPV